MNKFLVTALIGASLALSIPAIAGNVYVGATLNKTDINTKLSMDGTPITEFDLDNSEGYGLTLGYNMNSYTAFEYEISEFGSNTANIGPYDDNPVHWDSRAQTAWVVFDPTLFKIGNMPLKLTVRLGVAYTKIDTNYGTVSDTGSAIGGGFALGVTNNLDLILDCRSRDVSKVLDVYGYDIGLDTRVQSYNIGATYRF